MTLRTFKYIALILLAGFVTNEGWGQARRKGTNYFRKFENELSFHFSPTSSNLHSSSFSEEETGKNGFIAGVDWASYFMNYSQLVIGAGMGINYSNYSTERVSDYLNTAQITDADNDIVIVTETGKASEKEMVSFIEIPITAKAYINFWKNTSFFVNLGPDFLFPLVSKYTSSGPYTRTGYFPVYNSPIANINIPGTAYYYPTNAQLSNSGKMKMNFGIALLLNTGLKQKITSRYSAFGGFALVYGLKNINGSSGAYLISSKYNSLNSLLVRGDKISNIAYGLQLGVSVTVGKIQEPKKATKGTAK
jgi:hypothetical protein